MSTAIAMKVAAVPVMFARDSCAPPLMESQLRPFAVRSGSRAHHPPFKNVVLNQKKKPNMVQKKQTRERGTRVRSMRYRGSRMKSGRSEKDQGNVGVGSKKSAECKNNVPICNVGGVKAQTDVHSL
jgi:hypothetical protein